MEIIGRNMEAPQHNVNRDAWQGFAVITLFIQDLGYSYVNDSNL